ncbi:MAG: biopolymer transporter ExbD [Nitrospira sp.]|nr:biopolymer transporter ExbD [Candidatus Manganitrophaceae bacterium]HIL35053.1 biopolymer transporter ExbD [Candidatus Manganitrophaceae bacterium]
MRRRHTRTQGAAADINLTPLIDMVFILLIFFIVTTSFVKEAGIEVSRPSAHSAERKSEGNIMIAISENGEVWMDKRRIGIETVRANVERMRVEHPEGAVIVLADEGSKTGLLVRVIDQARLAGVSNVSIATQERRR